MLKIASIRALEILDSRGRPSLKAYVALSNGVKGAASVPSGASTGRAEAHELRDGDLSRYQGYGCMNAVQNINSEIAKELLDSPIIPQSQLDQVLINLDGTPNKSCLGANAMLAVSLAYARALANSQTIPLYQYFSSLLTVAEIRVPQLTVNLFSGGKHAGGQMPIQDVLIVPVSAQTTHEALRDVQAVYQAAVQLSLEKYGTRWLTADEGGLAPPFESIEAMFEDALQAIENAGMQAGKDIALALDVAASHFYIDGKYELVGQTLDGRAMVETLSSWVKNYPIISLEDGLAEEDWKHWPLLMEAIGDRCLVLGDDLLCTQTERIQKAIDQL